MWERACGWGRSWNPYRCFRSLFIRGLVPNNKTEGKRARVERIFILVGQGGGQRGGGRGGSPIIVGLGLAYGHNVAATETRFGDQWVPGLKEEACPNLGLDQTAKR